jgi:hypothetical protein
MSMVNWGTFIASTPTTTKPSTACSTGSLWPGKGTLYAHGELGDIHRLLANCDLGQLNAAQDDPRQEKNTSHANGEKVILPILAFH